MLSQAVSLGQAHLGDELGARLASKVKMAHFKKKTCPRLGTNR